MNVKPLDFLRRACFFGWLLAAVPCVGMDLPPPGPPADPFVQIPGTVVAKSLTPATLYLGSPSITVLPDGSYLVSNDNFGGGNPPKTQIYRSTDQGQTWTFRSEVTAFWSNLFVHEGAVYLLGTSGEYGNLVIRKSTDLGQTWTSPSGSTTGLLRAGSYHTAPMPAIVHNGRIWRAFEDIGAGNGWPRHFRAFLMSAPVGADLLNATSWTFTASMTSSNAWLSGKFSGWLEGNVVLAPDGRLVDILRADVTAGTPERAAMIDFGTTGAAGTFDPAGTPGTDATDLSGFINFPGGAKKFSIRQDPDDGSYWALANPVLPAWAASLPGTIRNTVALLHSPDLRNWETRTHLVFHPDVLKHGFQYLDWQFDGEDLIAVSRTSWNGADYHNSNLTTFHRFADFRSLTMADSVETGSVGWNFSGVEAYGRAFAPALLEDGNVAYSNRAYVWGEVPAAFAGSMITRVGGGVNPQLELRADTARRIYVAASKVAPVPDMTGWTDTGLSMFYSDPGKTRLSIYQRDVAAGQAVVPPQTNWNGTILLVPPAPGPVGWWRCENNYEGTTAADHLLNFHGTLSASAPVQVPGVAGNALSFTQASAQHANLGDVFPLTRVPFTIAYWMKTAPGDAIYRIPLSKMATGAYDGYLFCVNPPGLPGKVRFLASSTSDQLVSGVSVNDGLWHHVAVTLVPGGQMILYVDGVEQGRRASPVIRKTAASLRFGAQTAGTAADPRFQGALDEIQIHHSALGAEEILAMVLDPDRVPSAGDGVLPAARMESGMGNSGFFWRAIPGRNYEVYRSLNLDGDWTLQGTVTPAGQIGEYPETDPRDRAFFLIDLVR